MDNVNSTLPRSHYVLNGVALQISLCGFYKVQVSIDELYRKVKNVMPNVGECYADESIKDLSDVEFTQMMFLDGCFILQYIYCIVTGNIKQQQMKSHDRAFTRRNLFLLENQLPFEVLRELMRKM
ncbi:hypothetical protein FXO38_13860 [Capsicum annuum]|nr:hypothetical protein FXO38_13860 [Capsicum annuum]